MAANWTIGVCSWSLQVSSVPELERLLKELGAKYTQIALGDPNHASWEEDDETFVRKVKEAPFEVTAAMVGFPGEDYTSPETIKQTGGFGDPSTRQERLEILKWGLRKTKALGLDILTAHAGFIPETGDPGREEFLATMRTALDAAAGEGITMAFETGQETAALLRTTLDELDHPSTKINFDPANVLLYDKGDPLEAVRILAKDIIHVHAKDAIAPADPGQWGQEVPLGEGKVNMSAFLKALEENGYKGPITVEREVGTKEERIRDIRKGLELLRSLTKGD